MANIPPQGLERREPTDVTVGAISGPHSQIGAIHDHWCHFTSCGFTYIEPYIVRKKHSGKADQLTLASGGSEHA